MKPRALISIAMTLFAWLLVSFPLAAQEGNNLSSAPSNIHYVVKDLGTLGGTGSVAEGISDRGWVVGSANLPPNPNPPPPNLPGVEFGHAFLWRDGVMTDLGTLGGLNSSEQWPVKDDRGLIAGAAETSAVDPLAEDFCLFAKNSGNLPTGLICRGFIWRDGVMSALATLGGYNSYATNVNNRGQVVGYAENSIQPDPTCVPPNVRDFEAVIWGPQAGEIQALPPLPGDTVSAASDINDRGQVIGVSGSCLYPEARGVLWEDGTVTDLGTLGGAQNTTPSAINSAGVVVGQSDLSGDTTAHAFIWTKNSGMKDLGLLPGDSVSLAFGTNENSEVVGCSCVDTNFNDCRAFLWQKGKMIDVNSLVQTGSTPLHLFFGNDINDRGEIAAYAFNQSNGQFHAAVAIPCDDEHAADQDCQHAAQSALGVERPRAVLPENLREQFQMQHGLRRLGASSGKPR